MKNVTQNKIHETELFNSMTSMKNNKTPGNDGLKKKFTKISALN